MRRRDMLKGMAALGLAAGASQLAPSTASALTGDYHEAVNLYPPRVQSGWRRDFVDNFDAGDLGQWGKYGYGYQPISGGAMGTYNPDNSFCQNGVLKLRTQYNNGEWTSGALCTAPSFSAVGGRWELCARFPWFQGLSYAFLLWPQNDSWPPEIDFAEGRANQPQVQGTYHWGSSNNQEMVFTQNYDTHNWHTYGVEYEPGQYIKWLFDGDVFGEFDGWQVTDTPMWLALQSGAIAPGTEAARWGDWVENGVPGGNTPSQGDIEIAWVYHDSRA